jgi:Mg-chelatase subunit ChlD
MTLSSSRKSQVLCKEHFVRVVFALSILLCVSLLKVSPAALAAPQQALRFRQSDKPTSYVIVFCASGSAASRLQDERQAVEQFFKTTIPGDEFALVEFHQDAKLLRDFTVNNSEILTDIESLKASGGRGLWDALALAMEEMKHARNSQKGMLVIADGIDNSSKIIGADILERARAAGVPFFAISASEDSRGSNFLDDLSRLSGGFHISNK